MRTYECPSCSAAVRFTSSAAVFAVCEHCRSMVVRNDVALEAIGKMAELPPDFSPLQIGSTGELAGQRFTLLGRVRLDWRDGSWTEWYAEFSDGTRGWVAEAQGFFALSQVAPVEISPKLFGTAAHGAVFQLGDRPWRVVDRKEVTCVAGEGELPFVARPGTVYHSVDLVGPAGEFGGLDDAGGTVSFYQGQYATFAELNFNGLRSVPGWSDHGPIEPARRKTSTLACPNCAAPVNLRAQGLTMSVVCGSCGTIIDAARPEVEIIDRAHAVVRDLQPELPLGRRGELEGVLYEIIGLVAREDRYATWSEYLLFNPWHGFAWLVTFNGHWSLLHRLLRPPDAQSNEVRLGDRRYSLFADGDTRVKLVLGEFYWKVRSGEESRVTDYVGPPFIVSKETYPGLDEESWSAGRYIEPSVIEAAFQLEQPLAQPTGVYLNQPNPHAERWRGLRRYFIVGLMTLVALQGWFLTQRQSVTAYEGSFNYQRAGVEATTHTTPPFQLGAGSQPVEVSVRAGVDNTWMEFALELVNTATGATYQATTALDYYHGVDSDGAWSEGSRERTADFSAVPGGRYLLRVEATADPKITQMPVGLTVRGGGVVWANFLLSVGLLLLYPLWVLWRRHAFERNRWAESDHSPHASDDEE